MAKTYQELLGDARKAVPEMSVDEVKTALAGNGAPVVLDVREPAETVGGKIAKAIQIPVGAVTKRIGELEKHKDKTLLVYCKTGARSGTSCKELSKNGFDKVFSLSGGITAWQQAHLPISKK